MKIRNIENQTHRQIRSLAADPTFDSKLPELGSDGIFFPSTNSSTDERLLPIVERYSRGVSRLLNIRRKLRIDNVLRVIELLSNDKFLLCSKSIIEKALKREVPRVAMSVA
ncbi:MAG: hypothetical protein AAFV25_20005 [Bacteroidota bacterium]